MLSKPSSRFAHPLTIFDIPEGAKSLTGVPTIFIDDQQQMRRTVRHIYPFEFKFIELLLIRGPE